MRTKRARASDMASESEKASERSSSFFWFRAEAALAAAAGRDGGDEASAATERGRGGGGKRKVLSVSRSPWTAVLWKGGNHLTELVTQETVCKNKA